MNVIITTPHDVCIIVSQTIFILLSFINIYHYTKVAGNYKSDIINSLHRLAIDTFITIISRQAVSLSFYLPSHTISIMRSVWSSTKKKQWISSRRVITPQHISPCNRSITPPLRSSSTCADNSPPFSSEDLRQIDMVKSSLRAYYMIPEGNADTSWFSVSQIDEIRSTLARFYDPEFLLCADDFLWENIVPMRASR